MEFSNYQKALFDFVESDDRNLVVDSRAGSGKTSSLVEMMKRVKGYSIGVAFNKSIADELSGRVNGSPFSSVSTVHSLGLRTLRKNFGEVEISKAKLTNILYDLIDQLGIRDVNFSALKQFIQIGRMNCVDFKDSKAVSLLVEHYDMPTTNDYATLADLAISESQRIFENSGQIDFDDMIALPVEFDLKPDQVDNIFYDEAQDTNVVRLMLGLNAVRQGGRAFFLADKFQALYGFTGCLTDAVDRIIKKTQAHVLPLSVCYRCAKNIVLEAQKVVPDIEYAPWADDGIVRDIQDLDLKKELVHGDTVLCRTNAPLVSLCFSLIADGVKSTIRGKSIGDDLISLVKRILKKTGISNINDFNRCLEQYLETEERRMLMKGISNTSINTLYDKVECLRIVSSTCGQLFEINQKLESIFRDDSISLITLSTIHKFKGLENDRIFVLKPDILPAPWAKRDWEKEQEKHALYVCLTRARKELVYVRS